MNSITTDRLPIPRPGVLRVCTASAACPTTVAGTNDRHAHRLITEHERTTHGVPKGTS